ncbi:pantoate/beta-alanine ligase [Thermincola ferriacetica]|uniref:Pantothenate synthetase n=1 Tax=Thermincola ferriacetica TaxID=281456 RepID=A0A0L6W1C0_9FIRM|nr:pantoate--beta-alanine ligase [Thermincola ferriacetica]KNZ68869.1 pantoate/beta-alanine ligase [Thermincola ferriacetica]
MRLLKTIEEAKAYIKEVKTAGRSVGFVPTMGYLHEGHLQLMKVARRECDTVIISIFVNPIQFGVNEDYDKYPRDLTRDCELAASVGVDAVFAPTAAEMYPSGYATFLEVEGLTEKLCGLSRPGHFRGVTTVVTKLFNIVQPDIAYFGQKDAQQVLVIKKMVADLNMNLTVKTVETVREADGLAMSSRNTYLNKEERQAALVLYKSLQKARDMIRAGERQKSRVIAAMEALIKAEPLARIDYVDILSIPDLRDIEELKGEILIALAVYIGNTRLIDNFMLEV